MGELGGFLTVSEINDDKKALESRKALENTDELQIEASLRDQIPEKLAKALNKLKIGKKVVSIWDTGNANRTQWLARQEEYLSDWDEFLVSSAEGPFQHSSSLHIPMPLIVAKTLHARFLQAILNQDPPFSLKARQEANSERAELVQNVLNYTIKEWANFNNGADEAIDLWIWDWITTGVGLLKQRWEVEYTRFIDVELTPVAGVPEFITGPEGEEITLPTVVMEEKEVARTKKVFEGPVIERTAPEDVLIVGGKGDPQRADAVIQQTLLNSSELWTLADRKIFRKKVVEDIISKGPDSRFGGEADNIKQQRARNAGQADIEKDTGLDRYRILEAYIKVDVDGSGINSDVVVWIHKRSKKILRATFLHRINKAGKRPFFKIDFLKRPEQDYGIGIIEMLHPLSVEMDAMHNIRIDYGMLASMPFGFYRPTSSLDPETINLEPGALIPLDNPQTDVFFPNLGNRTTFGFQEEASLQNLVERLTGISDLSLGVLSGAQGATRTATGTRALIGELNANLDVFLRRLNLGWKQALEFLLHMLQQRIPKGKSFRITGETGNDYWATVRDKEDIGGDFDLELSANTATSNPVIQQQNANQVLQLTSNPLDFQLGIITPLERYEALKNFYKSIGVKDFSRFIRKPPEQMRLLSPIEEVDRLLAGIEVVVTPEMDHQAFITLVEEFKKSDELLGQQEPGQIALLVDQANRHSQMAQALQQQAAQQRNAQQVATNSALSQQPAIQLAGQNTEGGGGGGQ